MPTVPKNTIPDEKPPEIWTIGHSNHPLDAFLALLDAHDIVIIADVRSQPYSRYAPQYNVAALKEGIQEHGLRYTFFGDTLGGRPDGDEFYDDEGYVRYDKVAESVVFRAGIARLKRGIAKGLRVAMMCSEEDPAVCHRHRLIGRVLAREGIVLRHIRGDGRVESDADLARSRKEAQTGQVSLFGAEELTEIQEEGPWRSLLSVSPGRARSTSSDD
jgi:uncharacterized protein (DUF488 family)